MGVSAGLVCEDGLLERHGFEGLNAGTLVGLVDRYACCMFVNWGRS